MIERVHCEWAQLSDELTSEHQDEPQHGHADHGDHMNLCDAWVCICGNKPHLLGFHPCDPEGNALESDGSSSPGSRIRMPSSSDSIARFVRRSSTPISSTPSTRCRRSPTPGSRPTTPSGPTTASARCRPSCFCRGLMPPHSLVLKCLLDGEAYA